MKIYLAIILFVVLNVSIAYSDDAVTWPECVRIAKENNPELKSSAEKVRQAAKDIDIDLSQILPQVDSEVSGSKSESGGKKPISSFSYGMAGSQLIFDGFKTSSEVSNSIKLMQAQRFNYDVVSSDIRLSLRSAYVSLMRAEELVSITEDIAKRRRQNMELVKLRYDGGRENRGSLLSAEADVAQAEFDIEQAKRSVVLSQRELSKEFGFGLLRPFSIKPDFSMQKDYGSKPDFSQIVELTPFLLELMSRKEAARYNLNSREADFMPKVFLDGSLGRSGSKWAPKQDEWSAGFSVTLPLLEGGKRIAEVSKARSQLRQAEFDRLSGRDTVLVTLERSWKDVQDAITNLSVRKKFLEAGEERAKITRAQYAIGLATYNEWVIIEDNLVNSQKAYLNAQAELLLAEAYWIQAIGGTLDYDG